MPPNRDAHERYIKELEHYLSEVAELLGEVEGMRES